LPSFVSFISTDEGVSMKNRLARGCVFAFASFASGLFACAGDPKESLPDEVREAMGAPSVLQTEASLSRVGWTVRSWQDARVVRGDSGRWSVEVALEREGKATSEGTMAHLVYVPETHSETRESAVFVRPEGAPGTALLDSDLSAKFGRDDAEEGVVRSAATTCDTGCAGECVTWSCAYTSNVGNSFACFSLFGNPLGLYHVRTRQTGTTDPSLCTAPVVDWKGAVVLCPSPSNKTSVLVCGLL
jgi:hypothetical protein